MTNPALPAQPAITLLETLAEARRAMEVCNACRYCEGYCAVFPAMTRRRAFRDGDLTYLANLCHGCQGCYHACQYAPPHPFGINVPKAFAELRLESYAAHAWPQPLAALFRRNGAVVALAMGLCVGLILILVGLLQDQAALFGIHPVRPGAFYAVIPFAAMVSVAAATFLYALLAIGMSVARFWQHAGTASQASGTLPVALHDALTLKYLAGGGHGCNDRDDGFTGARRILHHMVFYGFAACFAATAVATIYHHLLGWVAPYAFWSLPVLLGTSGGLAILAGIAGLFWLRLSADPGPAAPRLLGPDIAMLTGLAMTALTGLLLLALRATSAMGIALAIHLGFVLGLFITLPYSRMVHGPYRLAALLRNAIEARTMRVLGD